MTYSASDAISAERVKDARDIDARTDDYATLTNDELANAIDRHKLAFRDTSPAYLIFRLAAARLRGECPQPKGSIQ